MKLKGCALGSLPISLRQLLQVRLASTQAAYPYPTHANPTPHEIFHLQRGCRQPEIKARYYELVRIYHPDAPQMRSLPPEVAHKRFQDISAAYDLLRGQKAGGSGNRADSYGYEEELKRRKDAFYAAAAARGNWDDATCQGDYAYNNYGYGSNSWNSYGTSGAWKDRSIILGSAFLAVLTFVPFIYHSPVAARQRMHQTANEHYASVRADAKEHGQERRTAIRKRLRQARLEEEEKSSQRSTCQQH